MFAAVAAGVYKDINEATRHMESDIETMTLDPSTMVSAGTLVEGSKAQSGVLNTQVQA